MAAPRARADLRSLGEAGRNGRGQRARRWKVATRSLEVRRVQLAEEGTQVQRVTPGVGTEPLGLEGSQVDSHGRRQLQDSLDLERGQRDGEASLRIGTEPLPSVMQPRSRCDQHDQPVPVEPLHGREQRPGRRAVGPVQVLDHDHDRPEVLEPGPLFEDLHSRGERLVGPGPQLAGKLEGSSAGELVGVGTSQLHVRAKVRHDVPDERRLPQAGIPFDPHHERMARRRLVECSSDGLPFGVPRHQLAR